MPENPSEAGLPLTDRLALDRTQLANERTLLAYVRTAIMLGVSGITLLQLFEEEIAASMSGWLLVLAAIAVAGFGAWRCLGVDRRLRNLQRPDDPSTARRE